MFDVSLLDGFVCGGVRSVFMKASYYGIARHLMAWLG